MKKVLFICSKNRLRSRTAETVFSKSWKLDVRSAGTDSDAIKQVTPELVEWAEVIFVMEEYHKLRLTNEFKNQLKNQRIICLDIPDIFEYMDPQLIEILNRLIPKFIEV